MLRFIKEFVLSYFISKFQYPRLYRLTEKRLIQTIQNAYQDVPFYRELYDSCGIDIASIRTFEDLNKLPFVNKADIRANYPNKTVSKKFKIDDCLQLTTTGSSGMPLNFLFSQRTYDFYRALFLRAYAAIGYRPWHTSAYIKHGQADVQTFLGLFHNQFISSLLPATEQIEILRRVKPDFLMGYVMSILEISQIVTPEIVKEIGPKFIFVNSEPSTAEQRKLISDVFHCPVYDEYSMEEMWMIAPQCKNHRYHLYMDSVWLEIVDQEGKPVPKGQSGELVLTSLQSPAMPFIRYRTGDVGRLSTEGCGCGSEFPVIAEFHGRLNDMITLASGRYFTSFKVLSVFIEFNVRHINVLRKFKLIQKTSNHFSLSIIPNTHYNQTLANELIYDLKTLFVDPTTFELHEVTEIPPTGVKYKVIESCTGVDALI